MICKKYYKSVYYIMETEYDCFDKFGADLDFGECATNKTIKFLRVLDLDKSIFRIPFISYEQTL